MRLHLALLALLLPGVAGCASTNGPNETFERGLAQAESGDVNGAIETLSAGVNESPGHVPMHFELARLQYEVGEALHLRERQLRREAAQLEQKADGREKAAENHRKANDLRAKATPYYQQARDHLRFVVEREEDDHRAAWASTILCRVCVFFEDWEEAAEALGKAIERGRPTGFLLAQWREFLSGLREKMGKRPNF